MPPLRLRPVFERGVFQLSRSLERRQSHVDLHNVTDVAVAVLTARERSVTSDLLVPCRLFRCLTARFAAACRGRCIT
jgi:hypothetical protein